MTLTGPGGVGKTRLAWELAFGTPGRVSVVDLAAVRAGDLVAEAVIAAVQPPDRLTGGLDRLTAALAGAERLFLLDNCEHVLPDAAAAAETLLRTSSGVTVLATSRAALGVVGEVVWSVGPLDERDAERLFVERARAVSPHFDGDPELIRQVCRGLDRLPLAIELAAARLRVITLDEIAAWLGDRLTLLAGGPVQAGPRHRTIRACLAWSYDALSADAQRLFRELSVFVAGGSLDAVKHVCGEDVLDGLAELVDHSLLGVHARGRDSRFQMLETVREYAHRQLAVSGDGDAVRRRHRAYFVELARRADAEAWALDPALRRKLDDDAANLRAALDDATSTGDLDALRIVAGLGYYWRESGQLREATTALERALATTSPEPSEPRALALATVAHAAILAADVELLGRLLAEAVPMAEQLGSPRVTARVQTIFLAITQATDPRAVDTLAPAALGLARDCADVVTCGYALTIAAMSASMCEDDELLDERLAELISFSDAHSAQDARRWGYWCQARRARARGELRLAVTLADHGLGLLAGERDDPLVRATLEGIAATAEVQAGDVGAAHRRVERALEHSRAAGGEWGTMALLLARSAIELAEDDPQAAWESAYLPPEKDTGSVNYEHFEAAMRAALALGDAALTDREAERVAAVASHTGNRRARAIAAYGRGRAALLRGDHRRAEAALHDALAMFSQGGWTPGVIDTLEALGVAAAGQGAIPVAARLLSAAETGRTALGITRLPPERRYWGEEIASLRDAPEWRDGAQLSLEEATAYARRARGPRKRPTRGWDSLTPIEAQVAELAIKGLSNPQIGERLFISRGTVKAHLRHVYEKLRVSTRVELALAHRQQDK